MLIYKGYLNSLKSHYQELLELEEGWIVEDVSLDLGGQEVRIKLQYTHDKALCSKCGVEAPIYDYSPRRTWRHLDALQCVTYLEAAVPRVECEEHGITIAKASWAEKHSRFTLEFEAFAIKVLQCAKNMTEGCKLLRINWEQAQSIMKRGVERGLFRRAESEVPWLGMDEKSFRSGHRYISVLNDIEGGRVLDVEEGRSSEVAETLIYKGLTSWQREMVCGVSIDMSAPYINAIKNTLENADIVHDKFHISQHLNKAVDITRRKEHKALSKVGDDTLKGSKYQWLRQQTGLSDHELKAIADASRRELEVSKAWYLKELFGHFWKKYDKEQAISFLVYWVREVIESGNKEMLKVARMLRKHLQNILTYFDCFITNAVSEGLNSKIQSIKAAARGFRSFENYRTAILFHCGKLSMLPLKS